MQLFKDFVSCCACVWEPCALRVCKRNFRTLQPRFTLHEYHICRKSKQGPNFLSIGGHRQSNYMDHPKDQQRLHLARLEGEKLHWNPRWKVVAWRKDKKSKANSLRFSRLWELSYSIHSTCMMCMFHHGTNSTYILDQTDLLQLESLHFPAAPSPDSGEIINSSWDPCVERFDLQLPNSSWQHDAGLSLFWWVSTRLAALANQKWHEKIAGASKDILTKQPLDAWQPLIFKQLTYSKKPSSPLSVSLQW